MSVGSTLAQRRTASWALAAALRPHQWTKNLLVFAGIVFSGHVVDPALWPRAGLALAAYCLLSSAAYLINDVRDVEADRLHPTKRFRPLARGLVSPRTALAGAAASAAAGLGLAAALGVASLLLALAFAAGQLAYTLALKRLALVDALAIAGLFVVRAAAGAAAIDVRISPWLLACTVLLALFLVFAKRRGELLAVAAEGGAGRAVLRHYSFRRLGALVWGSAAGTLAAYAVYAATGSESTEMVATIPFVLFGLGRYLYLAQRHDRGEEPDRVLLTDAPILAAVVLWALAAAAVLNAG